MSKIDPATLIGRTWGSLSAEERASLPVGAVLRCPLGQLPLTRLADMAWWAQAGHGYRASDIGALRTVASVPS